MIKKILVLLVSLSLNLLTIAIARADVNSSFSVNVIPSGSQCPLSIAFTPNNPTLTPPLPAGTVVSQVNVTPLSGSGPWIGTTQITNNPLLHGVPGYQLTGPVSNPNLALAVPITTVDAGTTMPTVSATGGPANCQSISSITPASASFPGGSPDGTLITHLAVAMTPTPPLFTGTLACAEGSIVCGASGSHVRLTSTTLPSDLVTNGVQPAGTYLPTITATELGAGDSPLAQLITVTGTQQGTAFNVAQTGSCSNPANAAASTISCTIPKTYQSDTIAVGVIFCGTGSCATTDPVIPFAATNPVTAGDQSMPCNEVPGARAIISQSGSDGDLWECRNVTGTSNDAITVHLASQAQFLSLYVGSFYGILNGLPEGGNQFGSTSATNFSAGTSTAVLPHDLVVALGHRIGGGGISVGTCLPSPCTSMASSLGNQVAEFQILNSSGNAAASNGFASGGGVGASMATIAALPANGAPPIATPNTIGPASGVVVSTSLAGTPVASLTCTTSTVYCASPYSMPVNPGGLLTLAGNKLTLTAANPAPGVYTGQVCATWGAGLCETFTLTVNSNIITLVSDNCPANNNVPDTALAGFVVSTCTALMSDGSHNFTGTWTPGMTCNVNYLTLKDNGMTADVITSRALASSDDGQFSCTVSATQGTGPPPSTSIAFSPNPASIDDTQPAGTFLSTVTVSPSNWVGTLTISSCSISPCPFSLSGSTATANILTNKQLGPGDDIAGQTLGVTASP